MIGGILSSTALTLLVLPVLYRMTAREEGVVGSLSPPAKIRLGFGVAAALVLVAAGLVETVWAHGVSNRDAAFVRSVTGAVPAPFMYLGAKHMVTGYDHLLFLVGVIFFLYRLKDVVLYVSLFTLGHSVTLLAGVLGGIRANPYLVDAVIGASVVYKGFENIGGFERLLGVRPTPRPRCSSSVSSTASAWRRSFRSSNSPARARHQYRQLQRRRRDWPGARADVRADRVHRLAHAPRVSPPRLR